jgi:hypothetical protein
MNITIIGTGYVGLVTGTCTNNCNVHIIKKYVLLYLAQITFIYILNISVCLNAKT